MLTEMQLDNWERKARFEFEETITETRVKLTEYGEPTPGHLVIHWGRKAFNHLEYEI